MLLDKDNPKLNIIILMIDILSILFSIQILIKCIFDNTPHFHLITITFILIISYVGYLVFTNSTFILNNTTRLIINNIILLSIFSLTIFITGGDESPYKLLYLLCIINVSIKKGKSAGIIMASMLSILILFFDLTYMSNCVMLHLINDLILACTYIFVAWAIGYSVEINRKHITNLNELANIDNLTNLYNYRYFNKKISELVKESKINSRSLSLIFLDIDDFKAYNDLNGHQQGDYALKHLANILQKTIRLTDIACRYGGEEFTIILPNTNENEAFSLAENIRKTIEKKYFKNQENQPSKNFTASLGVATLDEKTPNEVELIMNADTALYKAKFSHKNKVEVYVPF